MTRRAHGWTAAVLWMTLGACDALSSCMGCGPSDHLAELIETAGRVDRDHSAARETWKPAQVQARFFVGDGLRTGPSSSALVDVHGAGQVRLGSDTTIRFLDRAPATKDAAPEVALDVTAGEAVVEAGDNRTPLRTRFGLAVLQPGAQVVIRPTDDGLRYEVAIGTASFQTPQGETLQVPAGRSIRVGIGLAELDPIGEASAPVLPVEPDAGAGVEAPPEEPDPEPEDGELDAEDTEGAEDAPSAGLDYVELLLEPGQSAIVYDPAPPTAVGFQTGDACPEGAELRVGRARAHGQGRLSLAVPAGSHSYEVRCTGGGASQARRVGRGRVRVTRNAGTRRLPTTAPRTQVDADGRSYTVMYQSLLPRVTVRWPNPPVAAGYILFLRGPDGVLQKLSTKKATLQLEPGKLGDGRYAVFFSALDSGGKRSKETTIEVKFDNAAPTASLQAPPASGYAAEETVQVAGVAVPGSSISVGGDALPVDAQGRFSATLPLSPAQRALAIRFQHAKHGVRYYVRRVAGAER